MDLGVRTLGIYILLRGFGSGRILEFLLSTLGRGILRFLMFLCCSLCILFPYLVVLVLVYKDLDKVYHNNV